MMKLRGKKVFHNPVPNNYTKVPNELWGIKMNHVDKLVLMHLYYYPPDFILAYTRIANEISIGETTIKDSWKRLKKNGYVIEDGEYYKINLSGTGNDHKCIGTDSGLEQNQGTGNDSAKVQEMDTTGSASGHRLVQETTLIGTADVPNEEEKTKEEKELKKNNEEPQVVGVGGVVSDSATHPFGVASSSPPPTQLSDESKKTISKFTSNENERMILLGGFNDFLKNEEHVGWEFSTYEDLLMLTVYGHEDHTNNYQITDWQEIISLLTPQGNIQVYNTHVEKYANRFAEDIDSTRNVMRKLRQQLIASNK